MKRILGVCVAALAVAGPVSAKVPFFNATCPTNLDVHADEGGPIYVNGHETKLTANKKDYVEARWDGTHNHVTISVATNPDGSLNVSYTRDNGNNGICTVAGGERHAGGKNHKGGCPADVSEADRYKYPACN